MDRKPSETTEVRRLIEISEASRNLLGTEAALLRRKLDIPSRVRDSLKQRPTAWLLGSLGSGFVASLLFRRKPVREKKRRGISTALMGLTLTAGRPMAKIWLANQLKQWLAGQYAEHSVKHLPAQSSPTSNPP